MKNQILFSYKYSGISLHILSKIIDQRNFSYIQAHIKKEIDFFKEYKTPYACLGLPFDESMQLTIEQCVQKKQKLNPKLIIVIGIGGSSLGAKAVYNALLNQYEDGQIIPLLFLETVDADYLQKILKKIEKELSEQNTIIVNVVTKSGTTLETVINFDVVLGILKKYRPLDYRELVVITTDKDSYLYYRAQKENFDFLEIPKLVGGRFSVFSAVGLFPLALSGINIKELSAGARDFTDRSFKSLDILKNDVAISSLIQWHQYDQGLNISNVFLFSLDLEDLGKWQRQLYGESLGKEIDRDGFKKIINLIPIISVGSIDLHSVTQLYLSGAQTISTLFVSIASSESYYYSATMALLVKATERAYEKKSRPFCSIVFSKKNEYNIGQFLQFKMLEVIYLGELFNICTFDQPQVELYKQEIKNITMEKIV